MPFRLSAGSKRGEFFCFFLDVFEHFSCVFSRFSLLAPRLFAARIVPRHFCVASARADDSSSVSQREVSARSTVRRAIPRIKITNKRRRVSGVSAVSQIRPKKKKFNPGRNAPTRRFFAALARRIPANSRDITRRLALGRERTRDSFSRLVSLSFSPLPPTCPCSVALFRTIL